MWTVESWWGRLLQLLIGLERGQTGKSHEQSGRPTVHSRAVSWASPKRRLAVASGLWGLSLAAQTSPDHPPLYVFGITLGIVSCTHVTDTIPVYSRGGIPFRSSLGKYSCPRKPSKSSISTLGVGAAQPGLGICRNNPRHPHRVLGRDWWPAPSPSLQPPQECP